MSELLDKIATRLEDFGYRPEQRGEGVFEAVHQERWNFVFTEDVGGVLLRSSIETQDTASDLQLYDLINDIHQEAVVLRMYLDDDHDLALETWWPPVFEPSAFEMFIRAWNRDISLIARHDAIDELLR